VAKARQLLASDITLINAKGLYNKTPLRWAAINGHKPMVESLIEHGADLTLRDRQFNSTALGWALEGKQEEIAGAEKRGTVMFALYRNTCSGFAGLRQKRALRKRGRAEARPSSHPHVSLLFSIQAFSCTRALLIIFEAAKPTRRTACVHGSWLTIDDPGAGPPSVGGRGGRSRDGHESGTERKQGKEFISEFFLHDVLLHCD
jgi:hypothetical protein